MPLTEKQIKEIKYVSMDDFCSKIDEIADINDKLAFASQYLLMHGSVDNPDVSIEDAIMVAKMKILNAHITLYNKMMDEDLDPEDYLENAINPYAEEFEDDAELELFMGKPLEYLRGYGYKKYEEIEKQQIETSADRQLKTYYLKQSEMFREKHLIQAEAFRNNQQRRGYEGYTKEDYEKAFRRTASTDYLTSYFGGKNELDNAFNKTKPGFFSRMFNTSSKAYHNLEAAYNSYMNPNNVYYRDSKTLEMAAGQYIKHKFPNWEEGDPLPTEEQINALDATSKARMEFSVSIFKALDKGRETEDQAFEVMAEHATFNKTFEEVDGLRKVNQQEFQKKVNISLDDSAEDNELDNSENEISVDMEKDEDLSMSDYD